MERLFLHVLAMGFLAGSIAAIVLVVGIWLLFEVAIPVLVFVLYFISRGMLATLVNDRHHCRGSLLRLSVLGFWMGDPFTRVPLAGAVCLSTLSTSGGKALYLQAAAPPQNVPFTDNRTASGTANESFPAQGARCHAVRPVLLRILFPCRACGWCRRTTLASSPPTPEPGLSSVRRSTTPCWGSQHFFNVVFNLPFLVIGVLGVRFVLAPGGGASLEVHFGNRPNA